LNLIYIPNPSKDLILITFENYKKEYEMKKLDLNSIKFNFVSNFFHIKNVDNIQYLIEELLENNLLDIEDLVLENIRNCYGSIYKHKDKNASINSINSFVEVVGQSVQSCVQASDIGPAGDC